MRARTRPRPMRRRRVLGSYNEPTPLAPVVAPELLTPELLQQLEASGKVAGVVVASLAVRVISSG